MERLLTVNEVSSLLTISRPQLYRMVASRLIRHVRMGGRIAFSEKQIEDYLNSHTIREREFAGGRS